MSIATPTNAFLLPDDAYTRDLNLPAAVIQDTAKYLQLRTGQPLERCVEFVKGEISSGLLKDPKVLVLERNQYGDRAPKTTTFMNFVKRVDKENLLLSPSLTAYLQPTIRTSTHAEYIAEGVAKRSKVKKEMFEAELAGDADLVLVKDGEQNNYKINNNSYSGATVSQATILHYKSTHSSLTSTCRTATSYANSSNEKFIAGNRHYYSPEIIKANLISIIQHSDLDLIKQTCDRLNIHYPSVEDTLKCIRRSSDLYIFGGGYLEDIKSMLEGMTEVERAAVVYVADCYHLYQHNPELVKKLIFGLATISGLEDPVSDDEFFTYHEDVRMLANFLCFDEVLGRSAQKLQEEDPDVWIRIKNTARNALFVLDEYKDLIKAFWLTRTLPSSIHSVANMQRRAVPISDTDSTLFTLQYWVEQCCGEITFTSEAKRIAFVMTFLVSEHVMHILAVQSANMGVQPDKIRLLAMKNEYYFAVLLMTNKAKHYAASQDAREGIVFTTPKLEVKGVGLRDSKVPKVISDGVKDFMLDIITKIKNNEEIEMYEVLTYVADLERNIFKSIEAGSAEYMTTGQIKSLDSYQREDNATYAQYELWRDVFGKYFGETREPPYSVVNVSIQASNKSELEAWCNRMNHPELANDLKNWLHSRGKSSLNRLMVPATVVETIGIPPEIVCGTDARKIVTNTMAAFYTILETLGIHIQDKWIARLVSDMY